MDESKTTEKPVKTKTNLNIVKEVLRREHGSIQNRADAFTTACYGSRYFAKRMKLSHHLNQPAGTVQVLNFNNQGNLICAGLLAIARDEEKKNSIGIIDWASNEVKTAVRTEKAARLTDVHFMNAENYDQQLSVVSIYDNGQLRCDSLRPSGTIETLRTYELSKERQKLAKCPGKHTELLSAATSGTISHIDLRCEAHTVVAKTIEVDVAKTKLQSLSHHPLAPQVCASYDDYRVRTFDSRKFDKPIQEICPEKIQSIAKPAQISDAFYNYDGSEILAIYTDTDIFLLDSENKRPGEFINAFHQMGFLAGFTNKTSFFGKKSEYVLVGDDGQRIAFIDKFTGAYVGGTALWPHSRWCSEYFLDLKSHPNLPIVACATSGHFSILGPTSVDKGTNLPEAKSNVKTRKAVKPKKSHAHALFRNGKQCNMQ